jgi:hypothetical protein
MTNESSRMHQLLNQQLKIFGQDVSKRFKKLDWSTIGVNTAVFMFLIGFGLLIRLLLAYEYRIEFPNPLFLDPIIWNRIVEFNPNQVEMGGYVDFNYYYTNWIYGWYESNWYPYTDWQLAIDPGGAEYMYSYPPIFLYFLVLMWRPGMTNLWMAMPMIIADAACAGMVYLIIKEIMNKKDDNPIALVAGLVMSLSPINIIYDGVFWLNPGPVTLFTLVSFYFLTKKKWRQTFFWLALATMTKQNALFFTYPVFMFMLGERVQKEGLKRGLLNSVMNAIYYVLICLLCSIPWIFISPKFYGVHLLFPGQLLRLDSTIIPPIINNTIQFSYALQIFGLKGFLLDFVAFGINSMLFMIIGAGFIAIPMFWRSYKRNLDNTEFFEWISIYTIITHIFMPRGVYKFYSAYYMPIILIAITCSLVKTNENSYVRILALFVAAGLFFGFSFWHLTITRVYTPLTLFLACIVIALLATFRGVLKTVTKQQHYLKKQSLISI